MITIADHTFNHYWVKYEKPEWAQVMTSDSSTSPFCSTYTRNSSTLAIPVKSSSMAQIPNIDLDRLLHLLTTSAAPLTHTFSLGSPN